VTRHFSIAILLAELLLIPLRSLAAQGVAGASVRGTVVTSSGKTVSNARLSLTDSANGAIRSATTRENGVFSFDNVAVGGPYTLEARAVGFAPTSAIGIVLHVGDRFEPRLVLEQNE
jgi:hypothetical protein